MGVAGNADPMLGYLTTSFREHPALRQDTNTVIGPAMRRRLSEFASATNAPTLDRLIHLYAQYARAAGDARAAVSLEDEARRTVTRLRERGFDIAGDETTARVRVDRIYQHAREALYARLDEAVLRDACGTHIRVSTAAVDRDDYLAHPPAGERLADEATRTMLRSIPSAAGGIQIVVSDGLNADSINQQLRSLLPPLRHRLSSEGQRVSERVVIVQ